MMIEMMIEMVRIMDSNKAECVINMEAFEEHARKTKKRNNYDYEDETLYVFYYSFIHSFIAIWCSRRHWSHLTPYLHIHL